MGSATPQEAGFGERERTAYKLKTRYQWLNRFTDDELRDITVCYEGEQLKLDEQYFDLSHPEKGVIAGAPGQWVPGGSCYVAKSGVRSQVWQKLISVS